MLDGIVGWLVPLLWKTIAEARAHCLHGSVHLRCAERRGRRDGVTPLPSYLGDPDARLVRASAPLEALSSELWILTHPDLRHTARVKTLMAFLFEALEKAADLYEGNHPRAGARLCEIT